MIRDWLRVLFGRQYPCSRLHPHATDEARRACDSTQRKETA